MTIAVGDYIAVSPKVNRVIVEYGTVTKIDDEWVSFTHERGWKCRRKLTKYDVKVITSDQRMANLELRINEIEAVLIQRGWL